MSGAGQGRTTGAGLTLPLYKWIRLTWISGGSLSQLAHSGSRVPTVAWWVPRSNRPAHIIQIEADSFLPFKGLKSRIGPSLFGPFQLSPLSYFIE